MKFPNPFSPDNYAGTTPLPQQSRGELQIPSGFSSPQPAAAATIEVPTDTVQRIHGLLRNMSDTFLKHGMDDLATQADAVAELLAP